MRRKQEILEQIKDIRTLRDGYKYTRDKAFKEICKAQIRVLRWALGYNIAEWYWCHLCEIQHENLKCPKCGNDKLLEPT